MIMYINYSMKYYSQRIFSQKMYKSQDPVYVYVQTRLGHRFGFTQQLQS